MNARLRDYDVVRVTALAVFVAMMFGFVMLISTSIFPDRLAAGFSVGVGYGMMLEKVFARQRAGKLRWLLKKELRSRHGN